MTIPDQEPKARNRTFALVEELGVEIVTGAYSEVPFPTEAVLSERHGTSRSITREAVKMLTAKGLVSARPRNGTVVEGEDKWNLFDPDVLRWSLKREFSLSLLRHFSELRYALEPEAAALCSRRARESDVAAISEALGKMEEAERNGVNVLEADIDFHVAILIATGNPFFAQLRDTVETALRTSIRMTNRFKGRTASIPDHRKVRDAIAAKDEEGAKAAMRDLIGEVVFLIDSHDPSADGKSA